jgi:phosphoribosylformimino-5-aminoimidazole carboxamide ribotide isomerase
MVVYPAIDLKGGKVVRLSQGDAARTTVYADDPVAQTNAFLEAGARWLHVVDLDRAFGTGDNVPAVAAIARRVEGRARVQCGGGLRSLEAIAAAFEAGVSRVVMGTAAMTDPALVSRAVAAHGAERVAVGLDARNGLVAIRGWDEQSGVRALDAARGAIDAGITTIVYTDIARDGMLTGPDLDGCRALMRLGAHVIASGGFASAEDVEAAAGSGCVGAILGRAIYEGRVHLPQIIAAYDVRTSGRELT